MTAATPDIARDIRELIADTFDVPLHAVQLETRVEDVPGWDSLGHSVLITRLGRRFRQPIEEADAAFVSSVGELVARCAGWPARAP